LILPVCALLLPACRLPAADASTDFSKMRVGQLKQILQSRGEACKECVEKADFVEKIKQVFGVGQPAAGEQRQEGREEL
jgi:hypothetical protein